MDDKKRPLGITDVVLRDAHQSLFATRLRLDDMLPIAARLDEVGFARIRKETPRIPESFVRCFFTQW